MFRSNRYVALIGLIAATALTQSAQAQLIVGQDGGAATGGEAELVYFLDISGGSAIATGLFRPNEDGLLGGADGLAVDDANRRIYYTEGSGTTRSALYRVDYDDYRFDFNGRRRIHKIGDVRTPSGGLQILNGLAWDSGNQRLIGSDAIQSTSGLGEEGFHQIDINTGASTLIYAMTATESTNYDLRGFDYNPANGLFYATDEATAGSFTGLVSININGPSTTITNVISYASLGFTNIDGIAVGNNKVYFISGTTGTSIGVYDIATASVEPSIPTVPWAVTQVNSAGGWGPNALVVPAGSNLGAIISSTTGPSVDVEVGQTVSYTVNLANFGPSAATNVTYSIVQSGTASGTIGNISSSSSAVEGPTGTITGLVASFGNGATETITFDVTTTAAGTLTLTAVVNPGGNTDAYAVNNSDAISHNIRVFPDLETVLFTELVAAPGSNTSSSLPGTGFNVDPLDTTGSTNIYPPKRSPDGRYVAVVVRTNNPITTTEQAIALLDNGTLSVPVQRGITNIAGSPLDKVGELILAPQPSVNNSGHFAFMSGLGVGPTNRSILLYNGAADMTLLAKNGDVIPAFAAQNLLYGGSSVAWDSAGLTGNGKFSSRLDFVVNAPTGQAGILISDSGATSLIQSGVNVPAGTTETVREFIDQRFGMDGVGVNWAAEAFLNGPTTTDGVWIVNGEVVIQEDDVLTGLTSPVSVFTSSSMNSNGDWFVMGQCDDATQDWVVKGHGATFALIAKGGDPIYPGAPDNWDDATGQSGDGFGAGFHFVAGNNQGDYVIGGRTDNLDRRRNTVAVLNGTTEILREGDPVDLDGNGQFDDNRFVRTFDSDSATLSDDGEFLCIVQTTDNSGTADSGAMTGRALVRLQVAVSPLPPGADLFVSQSVSDAFLPTVGAQTTYSVQICNYGPNPATNVVLTNTLAAQFDFVSATHGGMETGPGSGIVVATIPSIPAFYCEVVEITAVAVAEGVDTVNTASAAANETDPNNGNNSATALVTVENQSDLSVSKVDNGGAPVGQPFTYTITITNNGPATATNVLMTDTLDPTTTFVSATNGAIESSPGVVTRTFASIANGASEVVTITVTGSLQSIVTNQVAVSGTETDLDSNNNTAIVETVVGDASDMSIAIPNPGLQLIGVNYSYTLTIANGGPATATNVQVAVSLPAGLNFVSATNGAVENPGGSGNVEASFATLASQSSQVIIITVNAPVAGTFTVSGSVTASELDTDDLNNTAQVITRVGDFRQVRAIYTQIAGHPTATVPGLLDGSDQPVFGEFDQMLNINASQDGTRWTMEGGSDLATTIDGVMMLGSGLTGSVFAQEGKQAFGVPAGTLYTFFDDDVGFNSNNDFAWGALTSVTANSDITYTNIGGVNANVAQTGSTVNGLQAAGTIGNSTVSQHLLDDGRVGFNLSNISPGSRSALAYWNNGSINVFVERNFTSIGGDLITGLPSSGRIFYTTPDGQHTLYRATIAGGSMAVYDGARILRTGDSLPDAFGTINAISDIHLANNGTWIVRGDKAGGDDWVVRNGVLVAGTGLSVSGGAETWGNLISNAKVNDNGDYMVVGNTSEPDTTMDVVITINGEVIVRESDPVDLNGNGLFDDDIYITSFSTANIYMSDDKKVHFLAIIRNGEGTSLSTAFLMVDVNGCQTILGDANGVGGRNGLDVQAFVDCMLAGGPLVHPCKCADMDGDGDIDAADAGAFAAAVVVDP